jgi:tRNA(fMet)-specific endonuclease VapC
MKFLIDANIAVYLMDEGNDALKARVSSCAVGEMGISVISYAEVAYGTHKGKTPPPDILDAFIRAVPIVAFDEAAARAYAELPFKRARFDRLLAAHALSMDAIVVTNNEADFADVPGLKIENWTV